MFETLNSDSSIYAIGDSMQDMALPFEDFLPCVQMWLYLLCALAVVAVVVLLKATKIPDKFFVWIVSRTSTYYARRYIVTEF